LPYISCSSSLDLDLSLNVNFDQITMASLTQRSALGQKVSIGTFYNAKTDSFLPDSILEPNLPVDAVQTTQPHIVDIHVNREDTYQKQFETMGISSALSASILAGLVDYKGSSRYLAETREEGRSVYAALHHTMRSVTEQLNFHCPGLRDCVAVNAIHNGDITHIVAGIEWGAKTIISARLHLDRVPNAAFAKTQFQGDFLTFESAVEPSQRILPHTDGNLPRMETQSEAEITVYSDMLEDDDGILLEDLQEAYEFLQLMPLHVKDESGGKGWPISYSLIPVEMLSYILPIQVFGPRGYMTPAPDCLNRFVRLFDEYLACARKLNDFQSNISANKQYLPPDLQHSVAERHRDLRVAVQNLKSNFAHVLKSVRGGSTDPSALWNLLSQYQQGDLSPEQLGNVGPSGGEAVDFIDAAVSMGAIYVGHNGMRLENVLPNHPQSEAYVLFFSLAAMKDDTSWKPNHDLLLELLQTREPSTMVAIVDCEATSGMLEKLRIARYQGGQEISEDVLEDRLFMSGKCFAVCNDQTLETENIQPPIQRRHVTIACPGTKCSVAKVREWLCPRCRAPIEYGFSDQYIYCACGRSLYSNYEFKCNNELHGPQYVPYESEALLRLLNGLIQSNYLNILILGETGVGKSTFINAMVNYLEFENLDEAIGAEKLNYVIPCSFSTQIMDRTNPNRPIEEKRVKIGTRDDERDGSKGDSATQKTTVYPVTFHSGDSTLTVRLIDTPGIGDSRGVDYDRQNMADILSTLSGYDMVHGILILLKSNNSRLTITFRYCVKELLTHLHHNAAANMAFGFTNTRISNYTPGDTYGPLKSLLGQHPDVGLKLETPTTYCFDSESFRYLAAVKSDVHMPNKLDFDRSWAQSRDETIRLITHFQSIPPHEVKNTMSLNGARQLISELTKPLAEISQIINSNIQLVEDQVQGLKDTRLKGDQLRNSLHVQKVQMNSEKLSMPRTVCAHGDCIEVRDDGKGQNTMVIIYKSHCHPVCYLNDVSCDQMAHPGLIHCAAFNGSNTCLNCSHQWQQHLHVLYELHEEIVTVIDGGIQQQLNNHADDITLKQTAIAQHEKRVEEYKTEREIIRETAAKFCVFLKNNSLAPYNDALIAYLDFLIKEEQAKVQAGGNNKRLLSLTEERHKHQEAIEIITKHMNSSASWNELSEGGVDRMVQRLYKLKHFGKNLQNLREGIATAHQATYRERPYTVKRKNQPRKLVGVVERTPQAVSHVHRRPSQMRPLPEKRNTGTFSTIKKFFPFN
jgi:GTPase SAR1 family protein